MKNVVIVLAFAIVFGVIGFIATAVIVQHNQNAANTEPAPTGDPQRDLANSMRYSGQASSDLATRQTDAMIGAGAGCGCGILLGIGAATLFGKARRAPAAG